MKKILFFIFDGLGDLPVPELGNKTPLEVAYTQNLDYLVEKGVCGLITPFLFPKEKTPTSEGAHIALFGYKDCFLGRGPYEAAGVGIKMKSGDIAMRVNFATIDSNSKIIDRRANRIEKTQLLVKALSGTTIDGVQFFLKKSFGHRAVLILRGENLSSKISGNDPHKVGGKTEKVAVLDKSKQSRFTAGVLNKFLIKAHQVLEYHPLNKKRQKQGLLVANSILVRGAGKFKEPQSFKQRYNLNAVCVAGGGLYKGVAKIIGMDLIKVKGATGMVNTNLKAKILTAKNALKKYDFVFCHIKATDTLGHDGNFIGKRDFIEKIDKNIKFILNLKNTLVVITADHCTPCVLKDHSNDLIPILVYGNAKNHISKFSEKQCKKGKLGKIKQENLMSQILKMRTK